MNSISQLIQTYKERYSFADALANLGAAGIDASFYFLSVENWPFS